MTERVHRYDVPRMATVTGRLTENLYRFAEDVPDSGEDVRKVISLLFRIKTCLESFDKQYQDPRFNSMRQEVLDDIVLGVGSCANSLYDLETIVARSTNNARNSSRSVSRSAKKCWNEILSSYRNKEGVELLISLDEHKNFMFNTVDLLKT